MKKKLLAIVLSIATISCMMPAMAFATDEAPVANSANEDLQQGQGIEYPEIANEQVWTGQPIQLVASRGDASGEFTLKKDDKVIGGSKDYWLIKATDVGNYVVEYSIPSRGVQSVSVKIRKTPTAEFTLNPKWDGDKVTKLFSYAKLTDPEKEAASSKIQCNVKPLKTDGSIADGCSGWADFKLKKNQVKEDGTIDLYYYINDSGFLDNNIYYCGGQTNLSGKKHPSKITITVIEKKPVVAENLTYNRKAQQLLTSGNSEHYWLNSEANEFDNIEDVVATDAGSYKIYYGDTFDKSKYVIATIAQFALTTENVIAADSIYNGEVQKPTISCKIDEETTVQLVEGEDYDLYSPAATFWGVPSLSEGAKDPMIYGTEGLKTIWISAWKGNYTTGSTEDSVTGIPFSWRIRALDPVAEAPVYNGVEQDLIDYDNTQYYTDNYKYEYSLDGETWTSSIAAKDADTYNVQWRLMMFKKSSIPMLDRWCEIDKGAVDATIIPLKYSTATTLSTLRSPRRL